MSKILRQRRRSKPSTAQNSSSNVGVAPPSPGSIASTPAPTATATAAPSSPSSHSVPPSVVEIGDRSAAESITADPTDLTTPNLSSSDETTTQQLSGDAVLAAYQRQSTLRDMSTLRGAGAAVGDMPSPTGAGTGTEVVVEEGGGPRKAMGKEAVSKDEKKKRKILVRVVSGCLMIGSFLVILYMGHVYICALVAFIEILLFRELVSVRYNTFFHIIEETIPLFRTTQWMWFLVCIFYTYSEFVVEMIKGNTNLHHLLIYAQLQAPIAFVLYSATFVLTIATMQTGHIRFQLNQLCWTIVVLCLTVGQLKYVMHNVYNGLFWFAFPILLVVTNDIMAYVSGMTCGRKFIHRPFISLSPNKTWEGFIGGWIFTMIIGWYLSRFLSRFTWMTCPTDKFTLFPEVLECDLDPVFHSANMRFPSQIFEVFPDFLVRMLPGVLSVCTVDGDPNVFAACVSGQESHTHHHFKLVVKNVYPIQIHALSLSMFASLVAPFGGFLASAIKRAYGIKDFDSIIPGHGGVMDRMDCQFLMALCTWVHYNTFVKMATVSVPKMLYMYNLLRETEQVEFLERITELAAEQQGRTFTWDEINLE